MAMSPTIIRATTAVETLTGTMGADNFSFDSQTFVQAGDQVDGGAGTDILWVTKGMPGMMGVGILDMPGNLDLQAVTISSVEELNFNYMGMPMPGQVIFTSAQFGSGLLSNALVVRGSWGSNDIVVNLVSGDSSFDASAWTFPTNDPEGDTSGTATSMWGAYTYTNPAKPDYDTKNVGTPTEPTLGGWAAGVVYENGVPGDTVTLNGSAGNNAITGTIVADILRGGDGDDTLTGGAGNDTVDGGVGSADRVVLSGSRSDYTITLDAGIYSITDNRAGSADGTDQVSNVETFAFSNATYTAAQLLSGDQEAPLAPVITSTSDGPPTTNPTWIVHGTAEPNSTVTIYRNNSGTITTVGTGTADAEGNFSIETSSNQHGTRVLYATATDAALNVSPPSLLYYQGGHHAEVITLADAAALAGISVIDGFHQDTGPDVLKFSGATTLTDAAFAKVHDVESLELTGASSVTLGAMAAASGIGGVISPTLGLGSVITGDGSTSITDTNDRTLKVNAAALSEAAALTLAGAATFIVAGSANGTTIATAGGDDEITGGGGNDTIDGGDGTDTAVYSGNFADYAVSHGGATIVLESASERDTVTNVEMFRFADGLMTAAQVMSGDTSLPVVTITGGPGHGSNTNLDTATFTWTGDGTGSSIDHYEYSTDGGNTWTSTTATSVTLSGLGDGGNSFELRAIDTGNNTGIIAVRLWTVDSSTPYLATTAVDNLVGTDEDEDFIINLNAQLNAGDVFDGGDGTDTFWAGQGMMDYEEDFDFSGVTFLDMEVLSFNWMMMRMPGSAVFTSDQFGAGLISANLKVYGAWGDQDITVNLADGDSGFDGSGWTFPVDRNMPAGQSPYVWGRYVYKGPADPDMMLVPGEDVGGNDTIHLFGSVGSNAIVGTRVDDIIAGGAGNDTLTGGRGADKLDGGTGDDTYVTDGRDGITEAEGAGIDTVVSSATYVLGENLENLVLSGTGRINGSGNALDNELIGNRGANVLRGNGGADTMAGGRGDDTYVTDGSDRIIEVARGGTDTVRSTVSATLGANLENLTLLGTAADGTGNGLANKLVGNDGVNHLAGGGGADVLIGGRGIDFLTGGSGRDVFKFTSWSDSTVAGSDRIVDFKAGDKIDVRSLDANLGVTGNQAFVLDLAGFGAFATGHIRQTVVGHNLVLEFNADRDSSAELRIVVLDHGPLTWSDFML